jgi:hypothetical protein
MNQRIIYQTDEGGVAVIIPAPECGLTIEQIAAKDVPSGKEYKIVDVDALPTDRAFRGAWEKSGDAVIHNMAKAKNLTKDRLRNERKPLLEVQDVAFQRALESGASTAAIVSEKQRLRDITKQVDALTSLDELKAVGLQPT